MTEIKVQESKGSLLTTIPKSIADLKGWGKGTILEFRELTDRTENNDMHTMRHGYERKGCTHTKQS